jgi:N-acetylmuramoyl-L-alanine amidase CwlA
MKINRLITRRNYTASSNRSIKYIVVHYVGATGGAEDNCKYFYSTYRGASAHYFVGHAGEVWQCVDDRNISWHCGATRYKHSGCRNTNSIGIELCCKKKDGKWYFEDATVSSAIELVKELMKKYNIPIENVIRHYDVTGKICPEPYVRDAEAWRAFKAQLTNKKTVINTVKYDIDKLAREVIQGKWGNGAERKAKLKAAGYDYATIQARVNQLLK